MFCIFKNFMRSFLKTIFLSEKVISIKIIIIIIIIINRNIFTWTVYSRALNAISDRSNLLFEF